MRNHSRGHKLVKTIRAVVYALLVYETSFHGREGFVSLLATCQNVQHDTQAFEPGLSTGSEVRRTPRVDPISALFHCSAVGDVERLIEVLWSIVAQVSESEFFHGYFPE
jgi:hypothetical protein